MSENKRPHRWKVIIAAGIASCAIGWQVAPRLLAWDDEDGWYNGPGPIGKVYTHEAEDYPYDQLGDIPAEEAQRRSTADTRVRLYDELDRPRFELKRTHRGDNFNTERFTVYASNGEEEAKLAAQEFARSWEEFGKLADNFTKTHRNPDFGMGQILIVIDNQEVRDPRAEPVRPFQVRNGNTMVYINVAPGQPPLEEQLDTLHQGAVQTLLHLAELDRKFPLWAQQGLAEYTADRLERQRLAEEEREKQEEEEGHDPETPDDPATPLIAQEMRANEDTDDEKAGPELFAEEESDQPTRKAIANDYWRWQRSQPDKLGDPNVDEDGEEEESDAFARVKFLLEGDDGQHAPEFLEALRELGEENTDALIASRSQINYKQVLNPPADTNIDELFDELEDDYIAWQADPLRGQPLFLPGGDIADPAMLAREKEMEVILKLAQRVDNVESETDIRPRVTEFGGAGQVEMAAAPVLARAIDIEQLYQKLIDSDEPIATLDAEGELLISTDEERIAEVLGIEDHRYRSEYRDNKWVLVTDWDDSIQLEAWLETNENNPSRPLVKFTSRKKEAEVKVAEFERDVRR
jgi:hypothetical protein